MARDTSEARASEQGEEDATSASTSDSLCTGDQIGLRSPIAGAVTNLSSSGGKEDKGVAPARQVKAARQIENNIREMLRFFPKETCRRRHQHVLGCATCRVKEECDHNS